MNLSEMKQIISEHGLRLTKSLGQNFLHDGNQLRKIVAAANLSPHDRVLEIGPGLGPLTELLVRDAGEVLAIEKDRRLATLLEKRLAGARNLTVITDDAMDRLQRNPTDWSVARKGVRAEYLKSDLRYLALTPCPLPMTQ
jgi:16S rRNA (adenine1518-N6/adenine1519-N6)-dimethyltransferase